MLLFQLKDEYISIYIPFFLCITHTILSRNCIQMHIFVNRNVKASEVNQNIIKQ